MKHRFNVAGGLNLALRNLRVEVQSGSPRIAGYGICSALSRHLYGVTDNMDDVDKMMTSMLSMLRGWPKGTKSMSYPVPGGIFTTSHAAYYKAAKNRSMWKGRYGKRRKALLDWLIQQTTSV